MDLHAKVGKKFHSAKRIVKKDVWATVAESSALCFSVYADVRPTAWDNRPTTWDNRPTAWDNRPTAWDNRPTTWDEQTRTHLFIYYNIGFIMEVIRDGVPCPDGAAPAEPK